ncbi:unnamed protein product [Schistocephalus solidus]|uniref:Nucleolar protein 4 helical domain-containing protein n=1 Tax=Schistocephalus solidus TaxID=70667 RepID=A0A3P7C871_SCHSO|nr:unnamed protein product [Schistocephalus solidus]
MQQLDDTLGADLQEDAWESGRSRASCDSATTGFDELAKGIHTLNSSKRQSSTEKSVENLDAKNLLNTYFKKRSLANSIPNAYNEEGHSPASSDGKKRCRKLSSEQLIPTNDTEMVNGMIRGYLRDSFSPTASSLLTSQTKYFSLTTSNSLSPSKVSASSPRPTGGAENHQYHRQQHKQRQQSRDGFINTTFFSDLKAPFNFSVSPDEETEQEEAGIIGPELLIAAYNNFVRKLVDETLDRTITFCEQPRHAISALERICAKAWPQLESKRHRNRIRAYLKACRRNSKKNRGQINMKEPPLNGLSVEARQMVVFALNLVTKDIEQLRQELKKEQGSTLCGQKNGLQTEPSDRKADSSCYTLRSDSTSYLPCVKSSGLPGCRKTLQQHQQQQQSLPSQQQHPIEEKLQAGVMSSSMADRPVTANSLKGQTTIAPSTSSSPSSSALLPTSPAFDFERDCMAAMMRLFPAAFHLSSHFGADFSLALRTAAMQTLMFPTNGNGGSGDSGVADTNLFQSPVHSTHASAKSSSHESIRSGLECYEKRPTVPGVFKGAYRPREDETHGSMRLPSLHETVRQDISAPPAHFAAVKYSPTLKEATARLLDVRPLTQVTGQFCTTYYYLL